MNSNVNSASDAVSYSHLLHVRCQPVMNDMIERAATSKGTRPAEYIRQTLLAGLRADGFDPTAAGSLYDIVEGKQRYALVVGDDIAGITYHHAKPEDGRTWLPVVHVDSEPFDIARHWRLTPVYSIEGGRVVCTYPIVSKTLEHM
ncbi:hypothetical protein [Bradyrhizobium sp. CSS354]|uniref:hypothetical protein n=1 Tax=Bradyrhizobium sp. CSS354 TaxID=2699172 RepID=UPI0023AF52CC|nr:hypothetical protein [Bradyrhizobium sp. CSS354]MDE5460197.1 hypothetical protein [Bradyrhizobium sp. CSS354]